MRQTRLRILKGATHEELAEQFNTLAAEQEEKNKPHSCEWNSIDRIDSITFVNGEFIMPVELCTYTRPRGRYVNPTGKKKAAAKKAVKKGKKR